MTSTSPERPPATPARSPDPPPSAASPLAPSSSPASCAAAAAAADGRPDGSPGAGAASVDEIAYRTHPYVCGAIGPRDDAALARLVAASPGPLHEIHADATAALWATEPAAAAAPAGWRPMARSSPPPGRLRRRRGDTPEAVAYEWGALIDTGRARGAATGDAAAGSWRSAAQDRLAAGLEIDRCGGALLHTCALGIQDLYLRRYGDALYFAGRIDPLLALAGTPLHVDWSAWASIFALTAPVGEATPFAEVRRMTGATAWRYDAATGRLERLRFEPPWMAAEPDPAVGPGEILDTVSAHVPGGGWRRCALTLSGGWDSRLLAVLARAARPRVRRIRAWTTSNDDGRDHDVAYARQVAAALRLDHRVRLPGPRAWVDERAVVRRRLGHQTTHHVWIMPLARRLHRERDLLLDGLAGDVLLKNLFVSAEEVRRQADGAAMRQVIWTSLAQRRLDNPDLLAPGVARAFARLSRAAFDAAVARFDGHPAAATLSVLDTRTVRAIAPSARCLLGPEADVRLPFVHPEVITAALRVDLHAKAGGAFYRAVLETAHPRVAALPSTNDPRPRGAGAAGRGERRQASAAALGAIAETVLGQEGAYRLLAPEVRRALKDPAGRALIARSLRGLRLLHWADLFAEWLSAYADRLATTRFTEDG